MNKTQNYQLNQWEAEDRVLRTDFNADNAKIDAALKTLAGREWTAAGHYVGDNAASRKISTGATPKAVYVCSTDGFTFLEGINSIFLGGLAVTGSPARGGGKPVVEIVSGGFRVFCGTGIASNSSGYSFHYVAFF